jgi:hypothetical protein
VTMRRRNIAKHRLPSCVLFVPNTRVETGLSLSCPFGALSDPRGKIVL